MTTKKVFFSLSVLLLVSLFILTFNNTKQRTQPAQKATIEQLESYSYVIIEIDESGLYGDSLNDDTGIFIDHKTVKGLSLNESDIIKVNFPKDDYETITHIEKVSSNLIKESFTVTSYDATTGEYKAVNNKGNTDKENLYFTDKDIQRASKLNVNDTVTAYYKQLEGEDQFIKVE